VDFLQILVLALRLFLLTLSMFAERAEVLTHLVRRNELALVGVPNALLNVGFQLFEERPSTGSG
jgi:hypothetical protein